MLCKRIIPTMLVRGRTLVKGERFNGWRSIGHAAQAARIHAARGVDELMILDIAATAEGRGPDLDLVRELSEGCFIPITVGGGVRSVKDIDALLRAGADKVSIGDGAWKNHAFVRDAASRFGSQAIVISIDAQKGNVWTCGGNALQGLWINGARQTVAQVAAYWQAQGAGEILLTSIDRDGTMQGYDLDLIREVSTAVSVPVIASGGCRDYADMLAAFKAGADACAAGALFAFTDSTPRGAAQFLRGNGVCARP